jgi:hypothetical protein
MTLSSRGLATGHTPPAPDDHIAGAQVGVDQRQPADGGGSMAP